MLKTTKSKFNYLINYKGRVFELIGYVKKKSIEIIANGPES